jgi:hypothetical protein
MAGLLPCTPTSSTGILCNYNRLAHARPVSKEPRTNSYEAAAAAQPTTEGSHHCRTRSQLTLGVGDT